MWKFGLKLPKYVALDVHRLPFADNSFAAATVIEALHHFVEHCGMDSGGRPAIVRMGNGLSPVIIPMPCT
jgi:hypothetical protein